MGVYCTFSLRASIKSHQILSEGREGKRLTSDDYSMPEAQTFYSFFNAYNRNLV